MFMLYIVMGILAKKKPQKNPYISDLYKLTFNKP